MRRLNVDRMRRYARKGRASFVSWPPMHALSSHYTVLADGTVLDHTRYLTGGLGDNMGDSDTGPVTYPRLCTHTDLH